MDYLVLKIVLGTFENIINLGNLGIKVRYYNF